jgi:hypothetical protein
MYGSLYRPFVDVDGFDLYLEAKRTHIRNGVIAKQAVLGAPLASELKRVCERVDQTFLFPIVYRVDVSTLSSRRLHRSYGSARVGSDEYLIKSLRENEFDLLFADYPADPDLASLRLPSMTGMKALSILKSRC